MTTPAFEAFLARLYRDAGFRRRFLDDPQQMGLELAAKTFAYKRGRLGRDSSWHIKPLHAIFSTLRSRF
jgi:hypothetical protein